MISIAVLVLYIMLSSIMNKFHSLEYGRNIRYLRFFCLLCIISTVIVLVGTIQNNTDFDYLYTAEDYMNNENDNTNLVKYYLLQFF